MDEAKAIQVIETTLTRRGAGFRDDPVRVVTQYWSLDGILLAEKDPFIGPTPGEIVEAVAKAIYDAMPYDGDTSKPVWVPHGNSDKQHEARHRAKAALNLLG